MFAFLSTAQTPSITITKSERSRYSMAVTDEVKFLGLIFFKNNKLQTSFYPARSESKTKMCESSKSFATIVVHMHATVGVADCASSATQSTLSRLYRSHVRSNFQARLWVCRLLVGAPFTSCLTGPHAECSDARV